MDAFTDRGAASLGVAVIRPDRLRINYLLEDTALFGGVKVVLHHANLLRRRGHQVRIVSPGRAPDWYTIECDFVTVPRLDRSTVPEADVNVATYWTTIEPAASLGSGTAVHYCQGFEGGYTHNTADHAAIDEAYSLPLPAFVVSPHLGRLLAERFGRVSRPVPPALEPTWVPRWRLAPRERPRVLVLHPFEIDWKGVATALEAARLLRADGVGLRLVRISQWPLTDAERHQFESDEFHLRLDPARVARIVAGCDLLLAPSWDQEGFGLPVIEAMACGVPVVASRIAAFEGYASDAAELVPAHHPEAFAEAARKVLGDSRHWRRMRRTGRRVARRFTEATVVGELESAFGWIASGDWRSGS